MPGAPTERPGKTVPSSSTSDASIDLHSTHNSCIIRSMAVATAILGASGYSGQETLDRVLAHPELELVALGSDSLAGSPASVLDPRLNGSTCRAFVTNDEALAAGAELVFCCLEHERAAALEPPADAVVVDLSGAHRLARRRALSRLVRLRAPAAGALGDWSYAIPELFPPEGPLIANPGCYATAVAARARAARRRDRAGRRRRRREVGRLRRRADAEGVLARGARCSRTSRRTRSARTSTRPRSSRRSASPSASSRTCCRCGAGCSPPAT